MKNKLITLIGCGLLATASMANTFTQVEQSNQCPFVSFQLPANPTTGYSWKVVDYNQARFKEGKVTFNAPKTKRIGAGGTITFHFNKIEKGDNGKDAVFLLAYGQAWEKESYENRIVVIKFVDKPCKR